MLRLVTQDPGRPRLTWYGDDGERVELSGAVLENWVNKVTNLLVEEFDAGPGTQVVVDLPTHWRTVIWALAAWRVGATTIFTRTVGAEGADTVKEPVGGKADVVITTRPAALGGTSGEVVAVALPALARRFDGELPPGAVDAASAVMTYGDQVGWAPSPRATDAAVVADELRVDHGDLVRDERGGRLLLEPPTTSAPGAQAGPEAAGVVLRALGTWASDGSVVLLSPATSSALAGDDARRVRLLAQEQVTAPGPGPGGVE